MTTLESYAVAETPDHWRTAAMPGADWFQLIGAILQPIDDAAPLSLSDSLRRRINTMTPGETVLAQARGEVWRLRRATHDRGTGLWRAQSLADSRQRIFTRLRCMLATRLAPQLLHDLRNPMNALSLHADLLGRLIAMPDAAERADASVRVVRERLRELTARNDALVALWLAQPLPAADSPIAGIAERALRVVRGHGLLREITLQGEGFERLARARAPSSAAHVEIALLTALLLACDSAHVFAAGKAGAVAAQIAEVSSAQLALTIDLPARLDATLADFVWDGVAPSHGAVSDDLALLLDDEPLHLTLEAGGLRLLIDTQ